MRCLLWIIRSSVACGLTETELGRRRSVLQRVQRIVSEVQETEHGYTYRFPMALGTDRNLVELEHQCCHFEV